VHSVYAAAVAGLTWARAYTPALAVMCSFSVNLLVGRYIPSGTSIGIAFIIFPEQSCVLFSGAMAAKIWELRRPEHCERFKDTTASGLIAGAGVMGVLCAIMSFAGVPKVST
jgi:uncharacterized oligopeptide transporter (OPT) family protein